MIYRLDSRLEPFREVLDRWPAHFAKAYAAAPLQSKREFMNSDTLRRIFVEAAEEAGWQVTRERFRTRLVKGAEKLEVASTTNWVSTDDDPAKTLENVRKQSADMDADPEFLAIAFLFAVVWRNSSAEAEEVFFRVRPYYERIEADIVAWAGTRANGARGDSYSCFLLGHLKERSSL